MIIPIVSGAGQRIDYDSEKAEEIRLGVLCENIPAELWEMFTDSDSAEPPRTGSSRRRSAAEDRRTGQLT